MAHDRCNFHFSFWAIFCPFTPLTAQKMEILKNEKNAWRYHHFTRVPKTPHVSSCVPKNYDHMMYHS